MATIVKGAKLETTTTYISHVRKELPKLLREKLGMGHTDWVAFLQAVHDVDADYIRDGVNTWEKEQETRKKEQEEHKALKKRIQQLEKLTALPTTLLRHQMSTFRLGGQMHNPPHQTQQFTQMPTIATNPFIGTTSGRGNLFQTTQVRPPSQNNMTRPPPTQADRAALLACIKNTNTTQTQRPAG